MKILLFGKTGQVATELQRRAGAVILDVYGRDNADFSDPDTCVQLIETTDADAVINAVGYTAVDQAEEDEALATVVNGSTPGRMAQAAAKRGLPFIHISTDYVFDGAGTEPFHTDHPTAPLGAYGRSKLVGEQQVRAAAGPHAILRTSWVVSAHGNNFVKTMLRLGAERDQLSIVADQIGGPTPAADIADLCLTVARQLIDAPEKSGTYHISGAPDVSWADFAREIFRQSGLPCQVGDIPSAAYPTPAKRPLNSRLDNSSTLAEFGYCRPDWRKGLNDILSDLGKITP
ncbi:dTDP-4-dehydrorhamnose reductase [Aliiroseovarius sp. xm-m-379]|uniref:dTDP-4-dehydrorhamnose reductase n=1 Tax=unclassified Aliiroseovarius TaxID=2623558 RepID=UPI0015691AD7|nr:MULTISPECIES: dTDP-4-dehydrorhamnose reductase [unclassified Aliiroseovarius]NRP23397.1 dTDP-4-dehydrorhamnose reductase [Aliiroseovarius sp. xm-m-379]NRP32196.1 dTDP-4-dehydrorhamnose reductase [Aliiroseovarius sp. xm-a-104]NRP44081.1 dTDP-4-dehydrorhamnose reductase [Aliiroseovarius sp. xm-m-378]NRP48617.1 dTDP-4-dehydrorhamnose reductase [Aliiroseovarius sp. xm-m-354]NRP64952.1 dTDP-4-dehydrorhamnose reductase [Aliiroseovarius sp. xm-v-225]